MRIMSNAENSMDSRGTGCIRSIEITTGGSPVVISRRWKLTRFRTALGGKMGNAGNLCFKALTFQETQENISRGQGGRNRYSIP